MGQVKKEDNLKLGKTTYSLFHNFLLLCSTQVTK